MASAVLDFLELFSHAHADDFPDENDLGSIESSVLIVHGDRDHFFGAEVAVHLYRLLPHAELAVFPRTGHWPSKE